MVDNHIGHNNIEEHHHGKADEQYDRYTFNPNKFRPSDHYIYPWYDDWIVPTDSLITKRHRKPVAIIDITVEEDTKINTISLKEDFDENFKLSPLVKEFLYQEDSEALDLYAPYSISVFHNEQQMDQDALKFDEDLNLTFTANGKYDIYRIVISIATDIYRIRPKWYPLLGKYYKVLPTDIKTSMYLRMIHDDWRTGVSKKVININPNTGEMFNRYGEKLNSFEEFDYDRYTKDFRSNELNDVSPFWHVNEYGGSSQDTIDIESPNKSNVGRANAPYKDGGITAHAHDQNVRVIATTIVPRKASES